MSDEQEVAGATDADLGDAHHLIAHCSGLINNADAKAGLVAAAAAVLAAGLAQNAAAIEKAISPGSARSWWALVALTGFVVSFAVTAGAVGFALVPRLPNQPNGGRFSYITVASPDWQFRPASREHVVDEAWCQAITLSRITERKFRAVRVSLYALGVATAMFVAWIAVTSSLR